MMEDEIHGFALRVYESIVPV
ncbi:protein of unknown function [Kyrpidia spormannii]|uniref:Uncharacterized protein n=2 Tax=Kyrpidia spormannii TaxID=2055160 RepID=A0ACA8ZEI4_9BACL|nr:protein of unknown function [Kyrpidia spormannii]CAB3396165.1 protein of unknown function [Kyrpidia spormannii]